MRRRPRGGDPANAGLAVEAVGIGMSLLLAIAIANGLTPRLPSVPHPEARHEQEALAHDALLGMENSPTLDAYHTLLDKAVAKALTGNNGDLESYLQRVLPPGAGYTLWLDTGQARRFLAGTNLTGLHETVSASRMYHPQWDYAMLVPAFDKGPPSMAMPVQGYPVARGFLVREAGVPVVANVTTDNGTLQAGFTLALRDQATTSLTLQGNDGNPALNWTEPPARIVTQTAYQDARPGLPATPARFNVTAGATALRVNATSAGALSSYTLSLTPPLGVPYNYTVANASGLHAVISNPVSGAWTLTAASGPVAPSSSTVIVNTTTPGYTTQWNFTLEETADMPLAAGTNVSFTFPYPFHDDGAQNTTQPGWTNWGSISDGAGLRVWAHLASPLQGASRALTVHAAGLEAVSATYLVHGVVGDAGGTPSSMSSFVLAGGPVPTTPAGEGIARAAYASVPKPALPGAVTRIGVVVANPSALSNPELGAINVQSVTLWTPEGQTIFKNVRDDDPSWNVSEGGSVATWTPSLPKPIKANDAATFWLHAHLEGPTGADEAMHRMPVEFDNGYSTLFYDRSQPYVFRDVFPPANISGQASSGFPPDGQVVNLTTHYLIPGRNALSQGSASFEIDRDANLATYADSLRLGIVESNVTLDKQVVSVGETARITTNFTGLLQRMGTAMTGWTINVSVYDPAQPFLPLDEWKPVATLSRSSNGAPSLDLAKLELQFTPSRDSFYGPYAVLGQASFTLLDEHGGPLPVTARTLNVVNVRLFDDDATYGGAALYWVILQTWLPDWS